MENQFELFLNEANAHFTTGRHKDAANTFEHLSTEAMKMHKYEDMMYFAYRALVSWKHEKNVLKEMKLYQKMGLFALKYSSKIALENKDSMPTTKDKMLLLNTLQKNLLHLDRNEQRKEVLKESITVIDTMVEMEDDPMNRIELIEKLIAIHTELNQRKMLRLCRNKMAENYILEAEKQSKSERNPEEVQLHYLNKALEQLKLSKDKVKIKNLQERIDKLR